MNDPDDNPFWGEPTPTDLWEDMDKLNKLYEELSGVIEITQRLLLKVIILQLEINLEKAGK